MMVYVEHVNPFGAQQGAAGRIRAQHIAKRVFSIAFHIPCGKIMKLSICNQQANALIIIHRGRKSLSVDKCTIGDHT